jgi:hypothetical protein
VAQNRCYRFGAVIERRMTDKQFQTVLDKLTVAHRNYLAYLEAAENEIIRRYGVHPSDIDNDQWIDSYHQGCGHMTVKQVDDSMKLHTK